MFEKENILDYEENIFTNTILFDFFSNSPKDFQLTLLRSLYIKSSFFSNFPKTLRKSMNQFNVNLKVEASPTTKRGTKTHTKRFLYHAYKINIFLSLHFYLVTLHQSQSFIASPSSALVCILVQSLTLLTQTLPLVRASLLQRYNTEARNLASKKGRHNLCLNKLYNYFQEQKL